ncbi:MAG: protein-glutamate O-methyltransferase CheR [Burkholderiaceae bacterium]|nr:protein-glutamate O-methyltransferase CheR [Burkholderiaceae bacterium]
MPETTILDAPMQHEAAIDVDAIKALVRERCGLCDDVPGRDTTARAVQERMAACGINGTADYRQRLQRDEQELLALVELLTINVSYLYREPLHDQQVFDHVLAPMLERNGDTPVRILSAGCAHGEELVSLAIALCERHGEAVLERVVLAGADIDRAALHAATTGRYPEAAFHALPAGLRQRYFTPVTGGGGAVQERLLRRLHYAPINLADAAPSPAPHDMDLIFYRNVSIYFDKPAQVRALRHLAARLKPGGVLVPGRAETRSNDLGVLRLARYGPVHCFQ